MPRRCWSRPKLVESPSNATTSPSTTRPGGAATFRAATTSGNVALLSRSIREYRRVFCSPRTARMRTPSSLRSYSQPSPAAGRSAGEASIGVTNAGFAGRRSLRYAGVSRRSSRSSIPAQTNGQSGEFRQLLPDTEQGTERVAAFGDAIAHGPYREGVRAQLLVVELVPLDRDRDRGTRRGPRAVRR